MSLQPFTLRPEHKLSFYRIGAEEKDSVPVPMEAEGFDPSKRTVIILPGTRINRELPDYASHQYSSAMNNLVAASLARKNIDANIICAVYGHNDEQSICDHFGRRVSAQHPQLSGAPTPAGTDIHDFVDTVLLPFAGIEGEARPSADEACEKLSKLTLVGNSYGTAFGQEVGHLLNQKLQSLGYDAADASRITSELVSISCGTMADVTRDEPGIRSITFAAERDQTTWDTARRIAEDLIRDGLSDKDLLELQREVYAKCGFDPALIDGTAIHVPAEKTELEAPKEVQNGRGRFIRFTAPDEVRFYSAKSEASRTLLNQSKIDSVTQKIIDGMEMLGLNPIGLNGSPLVQHNLVPAHDIRMYISPDSHGEPIHPNTENLALAEKFDDVLGATVQRDVQVIGMGEKQQLDLLAEGYVAPNIPELKVSQIDLGRSATLAPRGMMPGSVPGSN